MRRVGRYEVGTLLGEGASGAVHDAVLLGPGGLRKPVALKLLVRGEGTLKREARLGGLLRHRHLVDVYEVGEDDGTWFIAMERCDSALSDHHPLSPRAVVEVGLQVCDALQYAHGELGLVHLDLKPANLLVADGVVKVADLGIARAEGFEDDGRVRGTPTYMAPEQGQGRAVDARADIYALGVTLVELATGSPPEPSATLSFEDMLLGAVPEEMRAPDWLAPAVDRCLADAPDDRWPDMAALAEALRALDVGGPSLREVLGTPEPEAAVWSDGNLGPGEALLGRQAELGRLERGLDEPGVITLKGPAGIGKTQLAREAARRWQGRTGGQAWFCDGSTARRADELVAVVAQTLGVPRDPRAPLGGVVDAVVGRGPMVLVLDNLEQVQAAAAVVETLVDGAPELRVLATSRVPLSLQHEQVVEVGPLGSDAARALVVRRARERGVAVDPEAVALATLVGRLDGVPLALELAAGRLGVLSVDEVAERLELSLLRQSAVGRHATLAGALEWSWDLLAPPERATLAQLSVFAGDFTVEDAEAVVAVDGVVLDRLDTLVRCSMLAVSTEERFRLLVSVRDFAAERLEDPDAERRHGRHFAAFGARCTRAWLSGRDMAARIARGMEALPNLVAACERAVARGDVEVAVATCSGSWNLMETRLPGPDLVALLRSVLALDALPAEEEVRMGLRLGAAVAHHGEVEEGLGWTERSLELARSLADPVLVATALRHRGQHEATYGNQDAALATLEEALGLARRCAVPIAEVAALHVRVGFAHAACAQWEGVRAHTHEALRLAKRHDLLRLEGRVAHLLGRLATHHRDMDAARAHFERALEVARQTGNRRVEAAELANLGMVHRNRGDATRARELIERSLPLLRQMGNRPSEATNLANLGPVLHDLGEVEAARGAYRTAIALHQRSGRARAAGVARVNLAHLLLSMGELDAAEAELHEARAVHEQVGERRFLALSLLLLGRLHLARGERREASAFVERASRVAEQIRFTNGLSLAMLLRARLVAPEAGLPLLDEAEDLLPRDRVVRAEIGLTRAELLVALDRADEAREALRSAEALLPEDHRALDRQRERVRGLLGGTC